MDALRKVYHRAVQIPLENVETLWSELETFENNLNRITASIMLAALGTITYPYLHNAGKKVFE
jgi:cleavage stimulation factor subunit 3